MFRSYSPSEADATAPSRKRLDCGSGFGWLEVLALLKREPKLIQLNREVEQKALEEG